MRINFDRLSQLAGLPANSNRKSLYEGATFEAAFDPSDLMDEGEEEGGEGFSEGFFESEEEVPTNEMMEEDMDEMIEVDEAMLVQELRRAKRIMKENKRRSLNESRRRNMFEAQLKQVIDEEVQNVMEEMNLSAQWVYGNRKPRRSRQGYTHQGSMMPGIGFRR